MSIVVGNSPAPPVRIPYEAVGFPANTIQNGNGSGMLCVTWDDILRAAITVGRPGWYFVFKHGNPSLYEAIFRWSLVKMALEQSRAYAPTMLRTSAARNLDPTEKGMVNYFLGMTFCKLLSEKLLNAPWLLHLDVFRPQLDVELCGRSRPDLIGQESGMTKWYGFECKGRVSRPDSNTKTKAKDQALRLRSVNHVPCSLHVGSIAYFHYEELNIYWCDPPRQGNEQNPIDVSLRGDAWRHYYGLAAEMITLSDEEAPTETAGVRGWPDDGRHFFASIEQCDVRIVVHRAIGEHLIAQEWDRARQTAFEVREQFTEEGFNADGLLIHAGESWYQRREDFSTSLRR